MKNAIIIGICTVVAALAVAIVPQVTSNDNIKDSSNIEDSIVATISFGSGDAIIDMESVGAIYDFADTVVIGRVTEKQDATMSSISPFPYTPYTMTVDKVIKGEEIGDSLQFNVSGGTVTVKTFIHNTRSTWERAVKMGLTELSENEKNSKYVQYISNLTDEYTVGESYIMILSKCSDGTYTVIDDNGTVEIGDFDILDSINTKENVIQVADIVSSGKDLSFFAGSLEEK